MAMSVKHYYFTGVDNRADCSFTPPARSSSSSLSEGGALFPLRGGRRRPPRPGVPFSLANVKPPERLKRVKYLRSKPPDRGYAPLLPVLHYEYFPVRLLGSSQKEPKRALSGGAILGAMAIGISGDLLVPI